MIYGNPLIFGGSGGGGPTASDAILTVTAAASLCVGRMERISSFPETRWGFCCSTISAPSVQNMEKCPLTLSSSRPL